MTKTAEFIKVSKEVADAISYLRRTHDMDDMEIAMRHANPEDGDYYKQTESLTKIPLKTLLHALYFGYETKSPADELIEFIDEHLGLVKPSFHSGPDDYNLGVAHGARKAAEILGFNLPDSEEED